MLTLESFKVFCVCLVRFLCVYSCPSLLLFWYSIQFSSMLFVSAMGLQEDSLCVATVLRISNYRLRLHSP